MVEFWCSLGLLVLLILIAGSHYWLRKQYCYFEDHRIPYLSTSVWSPLGHLRQLLFLRISFADLFRNIYAHSDLDDDAKVVGFFIFQTPALMIRDPELIRLILIKNFNSFLNRYEAAAGTENDAMGSLTLPLAKYHNWRDSRQCMSTLFASGPMKQRMYPLMLKVAHDLEDYLKKRVTMGGLTLPLSEMCQLYTTDLTGRLFYGLDVGGLRSGHSQLRQITKQLFSPNLQKVFHFMAIFFLPTWTKILGAKVFTEDYANFMKHLVKDPQLKHQGDLIDQLQRMQKNLPPGHYCQHEDFIASQAGIILLAGFETSSSLLAFTLYELAKQTNLQERLRHELHQAFATDLSYLSYETLVNLPYLKMVCLEALRLYPAAAFINRECTVDSNQNGFSLKPHLDFVVPPGMPAYISILGLQRDEKYWPEPDLFDPERFSSDSLANILPMTYIPFGAGPHGCIGSRLGLLQLKMGLAHILRLCRVETCDQTVSKIEFNPKTFMLEAKEEIYLRFVSDAS